MKKKLTLWLVAAILLAAAIWAWKVYNKPHKDFASEKHAFELSAQELFTAFGQDEKKANQKYLGQVLLVTGTVQKKDRSDKGKTVLLLQTNDPLFGVSCFLEDTNRGSDVPEGATVKIKGVCDGYASDVVLTHCHIQETNP